jgi:pimeloyl-ACP methyl ester carboxylesterase
MTTPVVSTKGTAMMKPHLLVQQPRLHRAAGALAAPTLALVVLASACSSSAPNAAPATTPEALSPAPTSGTPSSAVPTDASTNTQADFAGLVDIGGGRKMYLECRGQGTPTVVLVSGYGDTGRIWSVDAPGLPQPHVLPAVTGFSRVCSYDRPGTLGIDIHDSALRSRSDPVPQPRAPEDVVADLHALLQAASVPGPYVLAGHSLGGAYVRLYAATYPDEVAGMVLVDAANEYFRAALTPEQWAIAAKLDPPVADYPEVERVDFNVVNDAVERAVAAQPLHDLPLVVLARGSEDEVPPEMAADFPPGVLDAAAAASRASQARLAALVPDARLVIATDSGHYIQAEQPALVIEAIRQVVEGVRHPNTWSDLVACCAP